MTIKNQSITSFEALGIVALLAAALLAAVQPVGREGGRGQRNYSRQSGTTPFHVGRTVLSYACTPRPPWKSTAGEGGKEKWVCRLTSTIGDPLSDNRGPTQLHIGTEKQYPSICEMLAMQRGKVGEGRREVGVLVGLDSQEPLYFVWEEEIMPCTICPVAHYHSVQ